MEVLVFRGVGVGYIITGSEDSAPVTEVRGLPHCSHQPVHRLVFPLAVDVHGILHRHRNHLLKQVCRSAGGHDTFEVIGGVTT